MSDRAPNAWRLQQVMSVAMSARDRLLAEQPDLATDEDALIAALGAEGVEAEDLIDRMIRAALEAEANEAAVDARMAQLQTRAVRYAKQAEAWRGAAFAAMDVLGITKRKTPEFSASVRAARPGVVITDEAALPDKYIRITRTPDKAKLRDELAAGVVIPGAELANGTPSLSIRKG